MPSPLVRAGVLPGSAAASALPAGSPVVRTRVDGFVCHLALSLADDELRSLIGAVTTRVEAATRDEAGPVVLGGRAATWLHDIPSVGPVTVKEYRRGGMLRHLRRRHYLRVGPTRPERELRIMGIARAVGVNVPEPVACLTRGWMFYRGWLATRHIQGESLVRLSASDTTPLSPVMREMTRQVRLLIRHRIAHVDLHPGNVIVDATGRLFLLDFDKAGVFDGTTEDLQDQYRVRWTRAVCKHGLPGFLSDQFSAGLYEEPSSEG